MAKISSLPLSINSSSPKFTTLEFEVNYFCSNLMSHFHPPKLFDVEISTRDKIYLKKKEERN